MFVSYIIFLIKSLKQNKNPQVLQLDFFRLWLLVLAGFSRRERNLNITHQSPFMIKKVVNVK